MKNTKSVLLWVLAVLVTVSAAIYQKTTGPTYPKKGVVTIGNEKVKYALIRTNETTGENPNFVEFRIKAKNPSIEGVYSYRRYKSYDNWTEMKMLREGEELIVRLPRLKELAGKIEYTVKLKNGTQEVALLNEPTKMRFKGHVPLYILIPHIFLMFFGLLWSTRAGIEAIFNGDKIKNIGKWALIMLIPGGLILGPIVQKYAFDAYWTGWPFGYDLTDNKTILMVLAWVIALFFIYKEKNMRLWAIIATIVVIVVYTIPHSARGSEFDYTKVEQAPNTTPAIPKP